MMVKQRQRIACIGLFVALIAGCLVSLVHYTFDSVAVQNRQQIVRIGYLRVPNDELFAIQTGQLAAALSEQGFQAEFLVFDSGVEANKALAAGAIDFASMGVTNGVVALSNKLDVELLWLHELLGTNEALVVKGTSGIKELEDLRGKTIATTFASTSHYSLQKLLETNELRQEVRLLDMTTVDIAAAWKRGDIDAAYTWEPVLSELVANDGTVLISSKDLAEKRILTANILLGRKGFTQTHPKVTKRLLQIIAKANATYRKNPNQVAEEVATALELQTDSALAQMQGTIWLSAQEQLSKDYLGSSVETGDFQTVLADIAAFLYAQEQITRLPTQEEIAQFIQTSYLENAIKEGVTNDQ